MNHTRRAGLALALVTAGISGVAVFLNGYGVRAFGDAGLYTTAKNLVAAVLLGAVVGLGARTGAQLTRPATSRQWVGLCVVGLVGGSVPFLLFFEGLSRAASVQAAFLHKTLVLWVALLAVVVLGERLSATHWLAIGLLLVGQAGLGGGVTVVVGTGEAMVLAATLLWSVEVIVAKRLLGELSSWTLAVARMGLGSALLVGWLWSRGGAGPLLSMTAEQWGWVVLTGVLLAGYVGTWFAALARAQAVDVTAILVVGALVTAVLGGAVQGSPVLPQLGWLVLLLGGTSLVAWRMWRAPAEVAVGAGAG
ncbi:MAG TPA: DMT family transporter [Jiangellales bacterium]|nr:DMT family transporter [Jiangellales bacterium]